MEWNRIEQNRTEQNRTEQNRTEQTKQNKTIKKYIFYLFYVSEEKYKNPPKKQQLTTYAYTFYFLFSK